MSAFFNSLRFGYSLLFLFMTIVILFWFSLKDKQSIWLNVPPVPGENAAVAFMIGDKQLAYRSFGITLQNMGDSGGRVQPLYTYNYERLGNWFFLLNLFDSDSNFIPFLASYYFSSTTNPDQLSPVIDFLEYVGSDESGQKWRWLAQAAYLARFDQKDMDKAMRLARKLAAMGVENMPIWAAQMPAFIAEDLGDQEAAIQMMYGYLQTEQDNMHPNEINFVVHMICDRLMTRMQADQSALCQQNPDR